MWYAIQQSRTGVTSQIWSGSALPHKNICTQSVCYQFLKVKWNNFSQNVKVKCIIQHHNLRKIHTSLFVEQTDISRILINISGILRQKMIHQKMYISATMWQILNSFMNHFMCLLTLYPDMMRDSLVMDLPEILRYPIHRIGQLY